MNPHPAELEQLDLYDVWKSAELGETFDPFRFDDRMATYRELLTATNSNGRFGFDNRRNPLWGLMFQHQWQFRTGRLGTDSRKDRRIDPDAPWGFGNYALCVVPWLGAVEAGVVPSRALAAPPGASRFRYVTADGVSPTEFDQGVRDWRDFFELVTKSSPATDDEPIRMALWKAHKSCLDVVADKLFTIDPHPYSGVELTFLRGWCRMVDYLWVAAWRTDFDFMSEHGLDALPERLLEDSDDHGGLKTLPHQVASNVRHVIALGRMSRWRYGLNLLAWKRIMRTRPARDDVVELLDTVFNPNSGNRGQQLRVVGYLVRP